MGGNRDAKNVRTKWIGGYIRLGKKGKTFVIDRWLKGTHFHISTKCKHEKNAFAEFERFEKDPFGYRPHASMDVAIAECVITPELIAEYERYQVEMKRTTRSHARDCARYLEDWGAAFQGKDIRRLDLHRDIKAALDRWQVGAQKEAQAKKRKQHKGRLTLATTGGRKSRIVALKGFTAWLRREKGLLKRGEDPTLDLQVPHASPEKLRRKKVVPFARVQMIIPLIRDDCRDTLMLLANTGLHVEEVRRFAKDGELFEPTADKKAEGARAMLAVKHKTGRLHVVPVTTDEAFEAAKRIRVSGWAPSHSVIWFAMQAACEAAGVEAFNAGVLRHSVATWLHEAGVPLAAISEQLGHRDPRTTADFYRDMGGQARVLPLPHLKLVR